MVELFEQDVRTFDRKSSKGNQLKWENNGIWYKADYTGYEGLAEYVISHLLQHSSLADEEFVVYEVEQIRYKRQIYNGARSRDFLTGDWQIITLERLFQSFFGQNLYMAIWRIREPEDRLHFLVEQTERITGLKDFGQYMCKLLTMDAFFLNEDRHTHNIAVLMNGRGEYRLCPIFDNGAGLLSDTTQDYPMGTDPLDMIGEVQAKTISFSFDEQLDAAEEAYGCRLKFHFTKSDVKKILDEAVEYPEDVRERVYSVICMQMRKYEYLF